MRTIDDILNTKPDEKLYHYTSLSGLNGIIRSKSLWASNIFYFNDSSEITYARDLLKGMIDVSTFLTKGEENIFLSEFKDWLNSFGNNIYQFFVFSLTEKGNLLSQWRGYTPKGRGVSIGFDPLSLTEIIQQQGLKIVKCVYDREEQRALAQELLNRMATTFRKEHAKYENKIHPPNQKYYELLDNFREKILQVFSIIKNPSFSEEQEWRIISKYYAKYTIPEIKYREGISMLVPYIEIDIRTNALDRTLFDVVYMGPTPNHNLSMDSLANFLSSSKACNETRASSIPYREW